MADSLIEIFDLCIERLAAGDTVEDCLKNYPDYADELRGMLETGALIFQAQADTDDEKQAQAHTRTRIEAALQTDFAPRKGKQSMFTIRRSVIWVGGAAAAVFIFTFGFAFAMTSQESPQVGVVADSSLPDFDGDGLSNTLETKYGTDPNNPDSDNDGVGDGDEVLVWATNPLLADSDYDGWSDGDEVNVRGTNPTVGDPAITATPIDSDTAFLLTATQYVAEITQTSVVIMDMTPISLPLQPLSTSTPFPSPTAFPTRGLVLATEGPVGTPVPDMGLGMGGGDTDMSGPIVPTSVAGYFAMTATMPPAPPASSIKDKDGTTSTSSDDKPLLADLERDRLDTDEFKGEGRTVADGVLAEPSGGGVPALEATPIAGDVSGLPYGTLGSEVNASLVLSQEQLNPMKAGEIDDNAEWDSYMEFRHNFIDTYGEYSVIDMDVSGRRIIKVVDAVGNPILGARVVVTAPDFSVETRTYATGMTLFFPNADESTKRRDEFKVSVFYDQYQAYYTLDLRKVGDLVEIQLPVVIVRDGTMSPDIVLATPIPMTTVNTSNDMIPPPPVDVYPATAMPTTRTGEE